MSMLIQSVTPIVNSAFRALLKGGRNIRILFSLAAIFIILAIISEAFFLLFSQVLTLRILSIGLGVLGGVLILGIGAYQSAYEQTRRENEIQQVEERVREHPNEPQAAWELGRIKLESYLNRNLVQINLIFFLTLIVMIAGFVIIGYGVVQVYQSPENLNPSIVVTLSGLIVEFIAATFLFIYRSTIEQAKDYVNILERINAVGMTVQILESIEGDNKDLKDKTRADIAKGLLLFYGSGKIQDTSEANSSK